MQRVGVFVELPRLLREYGVDPEPVLSAAGVPAGLLSDTENIIEMETACELAVCCVKATGDDGFYMKLGAEVRPQHMGLMGQLMASAPNLRTALEDLVFHHPRYVRGGGPYLMSVGEGALLIAYRTHAFHPRGAYHMARGAMAFGFRLFQQLSGAKAAEALVSLPQPADVSAYSNVFSGAKLGFGSHHFGLVYSKAALATPMIAADPAVRAKLEAMVAERLSINEPDVRERVMRALVPSVLAGKTSIDQISARLGMTSATLDRELRRHGSSFRQLLKQARFEMAAQFLLDARMSIAEIAETLGYSEVSAFNRFFAAIGGAPPAEWRARSSAA